MKKSVAMVPSAGICTNTVTFDEKLHDEESFRKTLSRCLQHFSSRKGWRYIGVWERSPEKKRLHFHGIFHIPEGTLPGNNVEVRDYDTRAKEMRITLQNDVFGKKFGHKNPTVTLNRYAHSLMEHKADMMNRLGKLLQ